MDLTDATIQRWIRDTGWGFLRSFPDPEPEGEFSPSGNPIHSSSVENTACKTVDPERITHEDLRLIHKSAESIRAGRPGKFLVEDPVERHPAGIDKSSKPVGTKHEKTEGESSLPAEARLEEDSTSPASCSFRDFTRDRDLELSTDSDWNEPGGYQVPGDADFDLPQRIDLEPEIEPLEDLFVLDLDATSAVSDGSFAHPDSVCNQEWIFEDLEEFQEIVEGEEAVPVETDGAVSRAERAFQAAEKVGSKSGWGADGICLLAQVFETHGWNGCRRAMERLLEDGLRPEELELARQVREIWTECIELRARVPYSPYGKWQLSYQQLSWPVALGIVRAFGSYADPVEIRETLLELFENWASSPGLIRSFDSFFSYLNHCLQHCRNGSLWFELSAQDATGWFQDTDPADRIHYLKEITRLNQG